MFVGHSHERLFIRKAIYKGDILQKLPEYHYKHDSLISFSVLFRGIAGTMAGMRIYRNKVEKLHDQTIEDDNGSYNKLD